MLQNFLLFLRPDNIPFCVCMYSFVCWTLGLLPCICCCEWCCCQQVRTDISLRSCFQFFYVYNYIQKFSKISGSYFKFYFLFFEELPYCSRSGYTILRYHQQWTRAVFSPHPHLCLFSVCFLIIVILLSFRGYLIVVSICVFLTINDVEHLFMCFISHLYVFFGEMSFQTLFTFLNYLLLLFVPEASVCLWSEVAVRA